MVGFLTVSLPAVRANYALLRHRIGPHRELGAVVKANAYGLGATEVAHTLLEKEHCKTFFVATAKEGAELRKGLASKIPTVVILGGFAKEAAPLYTQYNLTPAIPSLDQLRDYRALLHSSLVTRSGRTQRRKSLPLYLQLDTGMNRLGLGPDEYDRFFRKERKWLEGLSLECIMTHPCCADEDDPAFTESQMIKFRNLVSRFSHFADGKKAHHPSRKKIKLACSNSAATVRSERYLGDLCRPGMALYGLDPSDYPTAKNRVQMQQPITLESVITSTHGWQDAGAAIPEDVHSLHFRRVSATIPLGYMDGLLQSLEADPRSRKHPAVFHWKSIPCPVLRVGPSETVIDVTQAHRSTNATGSAAPDCGDRIEILGPNLSPDAMAKQCGTIGYEVLTSLRGTFRREYRR